MKYTSLISAIAVLIVIFATCATRLEASAIENKSSYVCDVLVYCERWDKFSYSDFVVPLWLDDVNSVTYDPRPPINPVCIEEKPTSCIKASPFYEFWQRNQDRKLKRIKNMEDRKIRPKSPFVWGGWRQIQKDFRKEWKNELKKIKKEWENELNKRLLNEQ